MTNLEDYEPNFKCSTDGNGKGLVNASIGLITYDEIIYTSGIGKIALYKRAELNYYLDFSESWWTMSPGGFNSNANYATVWNAGRYIVYNNGVISGVNHKGSILRPVINLMSDTQVTGSGTSSNPYKIS